VRVWRGTDEGGAAWRRRAQAARVE
jgi:hypothetical protein